ncbi:MAG TPA: crosslink repair DNA glycosylase YcaQ family protein [Candidatus Limnocylindrales bacterium]
MTSPLELTRAQIIAFRRRTSALDTRLPAGPASLRRAAWAGMTDSMPRAALLSIHARVAGTGPDTWSDPALVQLWSLRYSAYVVARADLGVFSLGRLPEDGPRRRLAYGIADELEAFLSGRAMDAGVAGRALGVNPNRFRYAAPTGRLLIRWDGARQPTIWMVPAPDLDPREARLELARRYLHILGPGTPEGLGGWAGLKPPRAREAFDALADTMVPVRTPIGDAWILREDEAEIRIAGGPAAPARLLPSGDTFYLLQGNDRELLVPDPALRAELWTSRVWPGALLVAGDVAGTWRRGGPNVSIRTWRTLSAAERSDVEAEAASLPLPGLEGRITVTWDG